MLLKFDPQVERTLHNDKIDLAYERAVSYFKYNEAQAKILEEDTLNPTVWDKQKGQTCTHQKFLRMVQSINPNLVYEPLPHPGTQQNFWLLINSPGLSIDQKRLTLVGRGEMPEYSFFNTREIEVYDPSYFPSSARAGRTVERADLPQGELVRDDVTGHMKYVYPPGTQRPGMLLKKVPWNEIIRGWRTVIARLVGEKHLFSPEQAESAIAQFGFRNTQTNKSWAAHMGKSGVVSPW